MKTILAVIGGGNSDAAVFDTAFTAAQRMNAHVECLHIRIGSGEAALYTRHVCYAMGAGLRSALTHLRDRDAARAATAQADFRSYCAAHGISVVASPGSESGAYASWREEEGDPVARILTRARLHDCVIAGRPTGANGLPPDLIERLLLDSGRPLLLPPDGESQFVPDRVMVCWKDTPEAARALAAAMPFLRRASKILLVSVREDPSAPPDPSLGELSVALGWHGLSPDIVRIARNGKSVAAVLEEAAAACDAGLVVMGGYGHSRAHELVFGGCTQAAMFQASRHVLLAH